MIISRPRSLMARLAGALLVLSLLGLTACGANPDIAANAAPQGPSLPTDGITTIDQSTRVNLKEMAAGQPALVVTWASWCKVCEAQMPYILDLSTKQHGFKIIMVNYMEDPETISAYLAHTPLQNTMQVLSDRDGGAMSALGTTGLPTSFVVDKHGTIVQTVRGMIMPQYHVEEHLAELVGPGANGK